MMHTKIVLAKELHILVSVLLPSLRQAQYIAFGFYLARFVSLISRYARITPSSTNKPNPTKNPKSWQS